MPNMSHSMQNLVKLWTKENLYIVSPAKILFEFLLFKCVAISSVQFGRSVVSDSLQPHGLQHVRLPRLSPTPRVYSDSCPSSQWCHPTISSSVILFSRLQSSQHQGLFKWVSSSHQVAKVLEFRLIWYNAGFLNFGSVETLGCIIFAVLGSTLFH